MADIVLETTIPDAWQAPVIEAFLELGGKRIEIRVESMDGSHYRSDWIIKDGNFPEKNGGESLVQYGERVLRELGKAVVFAHDKKKDDDRVKGEYAAIVPAANDLPDDVIQ